MFLKHFFCIDSKNVDLNSRITSLNDNDSKSVLNDKLRFFFEYREDQEQRYCL
jgi:hypothetical protein